MPPVHGPGLLERTRPRTLVLPISRSSRLSLRGARGTGSEAPHTLWRRRSRVKAALRNVSGRTELTSCSVRQLGAAALVPSFADREQLIVVAPCRCTISRERCRFGGACH